MYKHVIILGGSYTLGKRVAFHRIVNGCSDMGCVKSDIEKIKRELGSLRFFSTRIISTHDISWESVVESDSYYQDVTAYETIESFIDALSTDDTLSSKDIARYIISKFPCGIANLALQKLTYLCHAEYLSKYDKPLFKDRVCAFDRGPICYDLYQEYKESKGYYQHTKIYFDGEMTMFKSRLISSRDGISKLDVIDSTLAKYSGLSANELVAITHRENSPWKKTYVQGAFYKEIPQDVIKQYHYIEQ